jgi:hypothetical protein
VIVSAGLAFALGTYCGGWRIIRNLGKGLYDIKPAQGFCADTASTVTMLASSHLGFALCTTQVATGSICGAGVGRRLVAVEPGAADYRGLGADLAVCRAGRGDLQHHRRAGCAGHASGRPDRGRNRAEAVPGFPAPAVTADNVTEVPAVAEPLPERVAA